MEVRKSWKHTGRKKSRGGVGILGLLRRDSRRQRGRLVCRGSRKRCRSREQVVHVVAGALEDLDVPLLLAEDHVLVVTLLCRQESVALATHLDEGLSRWLTLNNKCHYNYILGMLLPLAP